MAQWQVGAVKITSLVENVSTFDPAFMLPGVTREKVQALPWLRPHFANEAGEITMAIQALVVETPALTIVIDTCVGNERQGRGMAGWNGLQTRFLEDFTAAGFDREKIDVVFCTHLHSDHVGWNTMKAGDAWVPTFPKARYLLHRAEYEFWTNEGSEAFLADSIEPIAAAGLLDLIELDHRLCEEIVLVSTPGHTPGHASVRIASDGHEAMISGDFIHHPCQMATPHLPQIADSDAPLAAVTRSQLLGQLADSPTLLIGTHFPAPTAGHVCSQGGAYWFKT